MKTIDKNRHSDLNANPINRDLLLIMILGFLAALSISTVVAMMASQY